MSEPVIERAPEARIHDPGTGSRRARFFAVAAGVLIALFIGSLYDFVRFALSHERNSYLLVIPALFGYLVWIKRQEIPRDFRPSFPLAAISAVLGALSLAVAFGIAQRYALSLQILSLLLFTLSSAFFFLGSAALKTISFPIGFLIFAVPLPPALIKAIEIFLQYTSAEVAYWMLSLTPVTMLRDGLIFQLPGMAPLYVAKECSGFNSTWVLFIVSTLAGHLFLSKPTNKLWLSLFVIPLAICRNAFRITVIALLCVYINPDMIDSFIHRHGGPIFFALSMIPFVILLAWLRKREGRAPLLAKKN